MKVSDKEILERLDNIRCVDDGGMYIGVHAEDWIWILDTLKEKVSKPEVLYGDCADPVSYCSNCSCGKKERIENKR